MCTLFPILDSEPKFQPGKMSSTRQYFTIRGHQSGKVLDASLSNVGEVVLWDFNGGDNQLWFWDGRDRDILRNKKFPNKVKAAFSAKNILLK